MKLFKNMKIICLSLTFLIVFTGCSSSTRSDRYNRSKAAGETASETADNKDNSTTQRFSDTNITVVEDPSDTSNNEFDIIPVEENPIDKSKFVANLSKLKSFNVALTPREKILFEVIKYLDTPYKYGGNSGKGIDCSAFTKQVYDSSVLIVLPRSAREQFGTGEKINRDELKFGDLVFFNTRKTNNPGHVGIYLGDNQFVHASRTLGVTVSSMDSKYYKTRFAGARRMLNHTNQ